MDQVLAGKLADLDRRAAALRHDAVMRPHLRYLLGRVIVELEEEAQELERLLEMDLPKVSAAAGRG